MQLVTIDFETLFDDDYSLKKLTTEAYIRDPRFEVHGAAIRNPDGNVVWHTAEWLPDALELIDWSNTALLCHHAQFDGAILAWRYGCTPALYLDTMAMARAVLPPDASVGLEALAKRFGLAAKNIPYDKFKGSHWGALSAEVRSELAAGACVDVRLSYALLEAMVSGHHKACPYPFPTGELAVIDATVRMFTEPVLRGDGRALAEIWEHEDQAKAERFAKLESNAKLINGTESFAELLRAEDIEPSVKQGKNGPIYCFAKTDQFMQDLLEHPCERVADLAAARLGVRSTIDQARAERLGFMAARGALPVYLSYSAALTRRWGGGDAVNWQNLPRLDKNKPRKGLIRKAVQAPDGYLIGKVDASQIECRILNAHAGQTDTVEAFRQGRDLYSELATRFYGRAITRADEAERGTGKQLELSCLGPATPVLTHRGIIPIIDVQLNDRLWDGVEWVTHQGLLERGERTVMLVAGLWLTPEHRVLCGDTWRTARSLLHADTLSLALASGLASLPSLATELAPVVGSKPLWCAARAKRRSMPSIPIIFMQAAQCAALHALNKLVVAGQNIIGAMQISAPMMRTDDDCLTALPSFTPVAEPTGGTNAMADVASKWRLNGAALGDAVNSWLIYLRYRGGISRSCKSIELTTTEAICAATSVLSAKEPTAETAGLSGSLRTKLPTYDIACAGPRSRFTIVSNVGPLIVHNCGYGAGAETIVRTAKLGLYGPPVELTPLQGVQARDLYRFTHPKVVEHWETAAHLLHVLAWGRTAVAWGPLVVDNQRIFAPGGLFLDYTSLNCAEGEWRVATRTGWRRMYGAKLVENVTQFLARVLLGQAIARMRARGLRIVLTVHDDVYILIEHNEHAADVLQIAAQEMTRVPAWMPDLPLACESKLMTSLGDDYAG